MHVPKESRYIRWMLCWPFLMDNYKKRSWQGPRRCILCKNNDETIDNILLHCPFTKEVSSDFLKLTVWKGEQVGEFMDVCFERSFKDKYVKEHKAFPWKMACALWLAIVMIQCLKMIKSK